MKVSIIIISYNEKQYLLDSIDSCLRQTLFQDNLDCEIIIGDDGSTDGSIEQIEIIKNKYPKLIRSFVMDRDEQDVIASIRVSNLLKRAFSIATGEYFQILSADDILLDPEKISESVRFLESHPKYASCYTNYKHFWDAGKEKHLKTYTNQFSNLVLWVSEYRHISCYVFRKQVLDHLLNRYCDDLGMIYSCLVCGKARHIARVSFGYRQRDKSIVHLNGQIDNSITDLLLLQDIMNKGKWKIVSVGKFYCSLHTVKIYRRQLKENKYQKYMKESRRFQYNILELLAQYDSLNLSEKIKVDCLIYVAFVINVVFRIFHKVELLTR